MGDTILSTVRKAARLAVYEEMMIKVKNHQTPPTMRPDRDLQARGKRSQKHRHQLQKAMGRGLGPARATSASCQALLHPFCFSVRYESSNAREVFLCLWLLIMDEELRGSCPWGVITPHRHIFTLTFTHTYTSRHMPTRTQDMLVLAHKITNMYKHPCKWSSYMSNVCAYIYE